MELETPITKRITRSASGIPRIELTVEHNLEYIVKYNYKIKKEELMKQIPYANYTRNTKLYVILYDYLKHTPCSEYQLSIFRNPLLTIQLLLLPNVLRNFNLFANYYQQKIKQPLPDDIKQCFVSLVKSNDVVISKNMVMESLNYEYTYIHKMFGKFLKLKQTDSEMRKRLIDLFHSIDEVIDIMNEDMLNDVIPLLRDMSCL